MSSTPSLTSDSGRRTVHGAGYSLSWRTGPRGVVTSPDLELSDGDGARWMQICALSSAHTIRPDALVITHTVHPSFGDVTDMVRTNDVLEHDVTGRPVSVAAQLRARFEIVSGVLPGYPVDTDQWPMPNRAEWLDHAETQAGLGVPALYYLEHVRDGEPIDLEHLSLIGRTWDEYRKRLE
ncbi:hypothetical protein [Microbacterium sp. B35-04]|uniref:hypothetical protein n=1 Tax=Microbacterium sp. B35-04 TaxID=1961716 RepID=UPI0013D2B54F|nr:hypothetical protein [Microbacterium sp. B35-04]